ncbi:MULTISPECIES: hypothetical protein [unclassified Streptomyces]|uniref:NHL domain-containing protein n=1 Tax=unclassified Streptomyces TaxID=2593676 RepID=UPI0027E2E925|nr:MULTISPECIES: hypothetical protein [unclassified Streptomyces]
MAGTGTPGYSGDNGPATGAQLNRPCGVETDGIGNLYITDIDNHRVRKVNPAGLITTVVGTGTAGFSGDNGPATSAQLNHPTEVDVDGAGNLYICDRSNHRVRKVSPEGVITTIAGTGVAGYAGDNGPAVNAQLNMPTSVAVDPMGTLYITDQTNHRVRKVSPEGVITTIAGTGVAGHAGDNGPAVNAQLNNPVEVALDGDGNLYITDLGNHRVRKVSLGGLITTIAGTGATGYAGDNGPAVNAQLNCPEEVALDGDGNLYITDEFNHRVRMVLGGASPFLERRLVVRQGTVPQAAPGTATTFNVEITNPTGTAVDTGTIVQRFVAPAGFVFTTQPTFGYYGRRGSVAGNLTFHIQEGGNTLIVTGNPHMNTTDTDTGVLVYTIPVKALETAQPGTFTNGLAIIGRQAAVPLSGKVTAPVHIGEGALTVRQESVPQAKPGATTVFNVEITSLRGDPINPGTITQRFSAPTGFAFTGAASYGYYRVRPRVTGNLQAQVQDGGNTLVITSNPHVNTNGWDQGSLVYTIRVTARTDATPGTFTNGQAAIGQQTPVPLTGTVLPR